MKVESRESHGPRVAQCNHRRQVGSLQSLMQFTGDLLLLVYSISVT
jgi:hypothetical protein